MQERRPSIRVVTDPARLDPEHVAAELASGSAQYWAQYTSAPDDPAALRLLNELSERHGSRFVVRISSVHGGSFDGVLFKKLPMVRSLRIDVESCRGLEHLSALRRLESLDLRFEKGGPVDCLARVAGEDLARVGLSKTPGSFDVAPLAAFPKLSAAALNGRVKGAERLAGHPALKTAALNGFGKGDDLAFVGEIPRLGWLGVYGGAREDLGSLGHTSLRRLRVARVRGLRRIDLARFPALRVLEIDDQPRLDRLDLSEVRDLNGARFANLPALASVGRLDALCACTALRFFKTGVSLDAILAAPPPRLRGLAMFEGTSKGDAALAARITDSGYVDAWDVPSSSANPGEE